MSTRLKLSVLITLAVLAMGVLTAIDIWQAS